MAEIAPTETKEALQYWCGSSSSVFKQNRLPNDKFDRLLRGIASSITSSFGQVDHNDLTPSQLAAFYHAVGGNYDPLFRDTPPQSIAFIYKSLGCLHSLQPNPAEDGHAPPCIPALKPKGFVTWQTIQLLLGPDEHVPFMQRALRHFDVIDPEDGTPFPKYLPKEAFPERPDEHMIKWHQGVSERLRLETETEEAGEIGGRSSTEGSVDGAGGERAHAAQYFSNPFYRNRDGRPAIVRHISKAPGHILRGGQVVVHTVRSLADTHLWSPRRSPEERSHSRHSEESYEHDDPTPMAVSTFRSSHGRQTFPRYDDSSQRRRAQREPHHSPSYLSPHRGRKTMYSSDSEEQSPPRHDRRRSRSYEPARGPREHNEPRRPHQSVIASRHDTPEPMQNQDFVPSDSPPFAVRVANLHQPGYFDTKQRSISHRSSYDHSSEKTDEQAITHVHRFRAPSAPMRPQSNSDSDARTGRSRASVDVTAMTGVHGRRYLNESPWR